eukprot:TRINITY_DN15965_c0_g1_i1.p1 TRINITY_DN15965_c0_g1~~TRINITY_DN15965_c0_g1_i1.p1  ORF type:complete len:531 (+),score=64.67 TRINITY_DN15965_c0_g1_i1:13-1605(+)
MWTCSTSPCCNESRQKREEVTADSGTAVQKAVFSEAGEANVATAGLVSASAIQLEAEKLRKRLPDAESRPSTRSSHSVLPYVSLLEASMLEAGALASADASPCSEPLPEPSSMESVLQDGHAVASSSSPHPRFIDLRMSCNPQSRLGITVDLCDNNLCFVKAVKTEGLVLDWNAVCKPGQDVRPFDRLIAVNGITGTTNELVKNIMVSIRKGDFLSLLFVRCIRFEASIVKNYGTGPGLASHMAKPEYLAPIELDPEGALQVWNNRVEESRQISKSSRIIAVNGHALDGSMLLKFMSSMKEFRLTVINWPPIDDRGSIVSSIRGARFASVPSALTITTSLWEQYLWKLDIYKCPPDWNGRTNIAMLSDWANWRYQLFSIEPDDIVSTRGIFARSPTMESRLCISYVTKESSMQSVRSRIKKSVPVRITVLPQILMNGKGVSVEADVLGRARRYKNARTGLEDLEDVPDGKLPPCLHAVCLCWTDGSDERLVVASPQLHLMVEFCQEIQGHAVLDDDALRMLGPKSNKKSY